MVDIYYIYILLKLGFMNLKLNLDVFGIQIDTNLSKTLLTLRWKNTFLWVFFPPTKLCISCQFQWFTDVWVFGLIP